MPWITRGILVSMGIRDTLCKTWTEEEDFQFKDRIVALYKRYRHMIGTLLRRSNMIGTLLRRSNMIGTLLRRSNMIGTLLRRSNMIGTLLGRSKANYFSSFFIENQNYAKKNMGRCTKFNKCVEKKEFNTY